MESDESTPVTEALPPARREMQVEKIHDIRHHLGADSMPDPPHRLRPVGVINLKAVRTMAFIVISLAVIACAVIGVLAVWEIVSLESAWRGLGSLGIVTLAVIIFVVLNEGFGNAVHN